MDRYGNQFATRVEVNVEVGVISADVLYTPQGMFGLAIGGVILSVQYASQEDAIDAADVILGRLAEGELDVVNLPVEGYGYDAPCACCGGSYLRGASLRYCDTCLRGDCSCGPCDDYPGQVLPTGWDAQDHKALYE